ncbi:Phosphate acetyltransferase [Buchnera aphidicola (Anoecia corni)]|uniref:Phosphate acetyltransferase n=1 Tax=Buchnera aphidicola (Anoecia corni) TaxID=2994477 RepID=A0AAT9IGI8_9GAMM
MNNTIMLIPIGYNVGLTTISLGLINSIKKKNNDFIFFKPFTIKKNKKTSSSTTLIIKKNKLCTTINSIVINKITDLKTKKNFSNFMEIIYKKYRNHKTEKKTFLIEGVEENENLDNINIVLNLKIANEIKANIIFVTDLKKNNSNYIKEKIDYINNIIQSNTTMKVQGLIINKINYPNSIVNIINNNKIKKIKLNTLIPKIHNLSICKNISFIPWNVKLFSISLKKLCSILHIKVFNIKNINITPISSIMILDNEKITLNCAHKKNTLFIIDLKRKININNLCEQLNKSIVLLVNANKKHNLYVKNYYYKKFDTNPSFLYSEINVSKLVFQLVNLNFKKINLNNICIENIKKYISTYLHNMIHINNIKKNKTLPLNYSAIEFKYFLTKMCSSLNKTILYTEGEEEKIIQSANICTQQNIASCILLGDPNKIYKTASKMHILINKKIKIINPNFIREKYINHLIRLRKHKGMNLEKASYDIKNNMVLSTLMLEQNEIDGIVAGIKQTTANTLIPPFQLIRTNKEKSLISSIFFMLFRKKVLIFADCAINISPNEYQLAEIAIQSANTAKKFKITPIIAMISYSTGNSGKGRSVEIIKKSIQIVKKSHPSLIIEGPIQYDAAINYKIGKIKIPHSLVSGKATIFIFPDLNTGNTVYKAVQQSNNIISIGPIIQGLKKPVNDLSRGSSIQDIVYTTAITAIQSYLN